MTEVQQSKERKQVIFPIVTILFMAICIFAYAYPIYRHSPLMFYNYLKNNDAIINGKEYYRLLTCTVLHGGLAHILSNMYFIWEYARDTEKIMGHNRQALVFLFSGLMGSLGSLAFVPNDSLGASGICFGVLGSLAALSYYMEPTYKKYILRSVAQLILLNLFVGFTSSQIDNAAHIFGFIGGYLITLYLGIGNRPHPKKIYGLIGYIVVFAGLIGISYKIIPI